MATSATTLIQRVRRYVGDWPELDSTAASMSSNGTTMTIGSGGASRYAANWFIQVDQEVMRVSAVADTSLTLVRGAQGSTAATHTSGATVLIRPQFTDIQILDSINAGINTTFPYYYKSVLDTSLTADGSTYEYTIPTTILYLAKVETKESGSPYFYRIDAWTVKRGATATLQFATPPIQGTLRLWGYGPFAQLAFADSLDAQWPAFGDDPLIEYATNRLLMSAEASRVRRDAGPQDDAQTAPRQGVMSSTAGLLLQRFQSRLVNQPMPPMPKHIVRIF